MIETWLTDKQMALRYSCSRVWIWNQARKDPSFPQPIRFTNGMTRFSAAKADEYDAKKLNEHQAATSSNAN